jgi:3',5'-cyclic AMP phosphodiesterase CpdA
MTTVLHMTDLHVGNQEQRAYGVNTRANFDALAAAAEREKADYLVLTGDLVLDEDDTSLYDYVRSALPAVPGGILVTPGNHDTMSALRDAFPDQFSSTQFPYTTLSINNEQVILLDSSSGRIDEKQLTFLEETIRAENASFDDRDSNRLIIFLHHPPVFAGVRYIDAPGKPKFDFPAGNT